MADNSQTFGTGPESQGVQFVLSVQDFGTEILTAADKAFQKLLDVMKQVAAATDKFTANILSKMTQASQVDKQNGGVAPLKRGEDGSTRRVAEGSEGGVQAD